MSHAVVTVWFPLSVASFVTFNGLRVAHDSIYIAGKEILRNRGYDWHHDSVDKRKCTVYGILGGIVTGCITFGIVDKTLTRQLLSPTDAAAQYRWKSMKQQIIDSRPSVSLTWRSVLTNLSPFSMSYTSSRKFFRTHGPRLFIGWLSLTWAVIFAGIARPITEAYTCCHYEEPKRYTEQHKQKLKEQKIAAARSRGM